MFWHTGNDPPPVDVATAPLVVAVAFESSVVEVAAPGFAFMVVVAPLIVVRAGVIVATGLPLASTDTQGSRGDSVTRGKSDAVHRALKITYRILVPQELQT